MSRRDRPFADVRSHYIHVMDLAEGHLLAIEALGRDQTFKPSAAAQSSGFGHSGGKYKAYTLGKGKGMSVLQMIEAMRKASGCVSSRAASSCAQLRLQVHVRDHCTARADQDRPTGQVFERLWFHSLVSLSHWVDHSRH